MKPSKDQKGSVLGNRELVWEDNDKTKNASDSSTTEDVPIKKEEIPPVSFLQLYRYATRMDKFLLFFGTLCTIGSGIVQPLSILIFGSLTGDIISFAQNRVTEDASFYEIWRAITTNDEFMESIKKFAIYNSALGAGMLVLSYLSTVMFNYSAIRQIYRIRSLYFKCALNQDITWYDQNQTGDFASRMGEDLTKLEDGLGEKVSMFIMFQVTFLASLIQALVKGWELALICLTSLPISMISIGLVAFLTGKFAKKEMDAYGAAGAIAEEVFAAIRTVVAFGGQRKETERYSNRLVEARDNNMRRSFLNGIGFGLLWFFIYASYALAFWYGVKLILRDKYLPEDEQLYNAGVMVTVFFSVMQGSMNFGMSSPYIEAFGIAKGAAGKIFSVIDNVPIINASKNTGKKLGTIKGKLVFKDVHFEYPSRPSVKILQGLNITIESGETVALVGSSGCGKSTCIQLLQRFYDPSAGDVYVDGEKLTELDLNWYRNNVGVVGQEPVLFGTTIAANIKYGCATATQEDVERAAKKANAHIFISSLPMGYETIVGERGAQLSGGQKQRIAIARALVREPSILLLDEATSALDTSSEAKVQAAIDNASKDYTTIIVAHRLSTIRNANRIIVMSEGKNVEEGSHSELMDKKSMYYNLVMAQTSPHEGLTRQISVESEPEEVFTIDDKKMSIVENALNTEEMEEKTTSPASLVAIMKLNAPEWFVITIGCLSSILMGASMPAFAVLFGEVISVLSNPDEDYVRSETNTYVILFVAAGVVTGFATFLQIYVFSIAGEKMTMRLRELMFKVMLKQEIGWFDRRENGVGNLCSRLSSEASSVQGATGQRIGTILQSISTLFISVGLSMYYEWKLGLVAMSFTPVILAAIFFQQRLVHAENEGRLASMEKSTKVAVEAVSSIRTVASLGIEDIFYSQYVTELYVTVRLMKRNSHVRAFVIGLARSIMFFAYATCLYYGGVLIVKENMSYEKVFKVSQALIMGTVSIANALAFAPNLQKGLTAAEKIFRLLNRTPLIQDYSNAVNARWNTRNINYSGVFFSYPTRSGVRVLKGLDLSIFEGQTVALVGPSGCGKSTVVQLLERYYDPQGGSVTADDENIRDVTLDSLRSQLGIVSQEPNLFDKTIGENIAYGDNSRHVSTEEVVEAAKKANIHNFIASLPLGYETRLGERGTQLSGGQKQRIAIARALVRNPKVLLLDEATSALDTESERVVQEALDKAKVGRTCITIAHRLTTIQDADVICVLSNGIVAEMGTHAELLQLRGIYYTLYKLQKGRRNV